MSLEVFKEKAEQEMQRQLTEGKQMEEAVLKEVEKRMWFR